MDHFYWSTIETDRVLPVLDGSGRAYPPLDLKKMLILTMKIWKLALFVQI
jgi:hypothetical protein